MVKMPVPDPKNTLSATIKDSAYETEKQRYVKYLQSSTGRSGKSEEVRTTPLFSLKAQHAVEPEILPQYGLLGHHVGDYPLVGEAEPIMLNVNAPNSTFICGSQGSGKSYTLSCMLENCLLDDGDAERLVSPVAGVVFHYDQDANTVAETAHLCSRGIKVRVLVSKSSACTDIQDRYQALPGAKENLSIQYLVLQDRHLSVERMLKMMAFSESDDRVPLYMEVIQRILRETAINGEKFNFDKFMLKLKEQNFSAGQSNMWMRLDLLKSFLAVRGSNEMSIDCFQTKPGELTIVDLSDPFVDQASACVLFDICLALFKENRPAAGLVVTLDEAHKFLNQSAAAGNFTNRLLTTIREQRHNATRVIVATQEPTISPKLLDLCSTSIVHHFNSPDWFTSIKAHLGGASSMLAKTEEQDDLFKRIMDLDVGESLVFSPGSFVHVDEQEGKPKKLGTGILKMKTRSRLGADGGRSVLASGWAHGTLLMSDTVYKAGASASEDEE